MMRKSFKQYKDINENAISKKRMFGNRIAVLTMSGSEKLFKNWQKQTA
jgi:hypothetical protein